MSKGQVNEFENIKSTGRYPSKAKFRSRFKNEKVRKTTKKEEAQAVSQESQTT